MELQSNGRLLYDDDVLVGIDHTWSTDYYLGVRGWMISKKGPLKNVEFRIGELSVPITQWLPRPELAEICAKHGCDINVGFQIVVPRKVRHELAITAMTDTGPLEKTATILGSDPIKPQNFRIDSGQLFENFREYINQGKRVLEIGSRVVSPGSSSKRPLFSGASEYIGFDYYGDDNTDVVGDAHKLASYLPGEQFDGVFSLAVFEHLAMPWVVAVEVNKVLKIGGLTFHNVPSTFPIHERPWDFWRYTEESLSVLFSPATGFEVIATGYGGPVRVYPDTLSDGVRNLMPLHGTFSGVNILARKVADVDPARFRWDATIEEALGKDSHYPKPRKQTVSA